MKIYIDNIDTSICKLIRKLNPPDDELLEIYRFDTLLFKPIKAKVWKGLSVSETDKIGPKFIKYTPFNGGWLK